MYNLTVAHNSKQNSSYSLQLEYIMTDLLKC